MKLEIGSGYHPHLGFEHMDINPKLPHVEHAQDATKLSKFADGSIGEVLSVDCIEHFGWPVVPDVLKEWVRIIVPGGVIRIETSDFDAILRIYKEPGHATLNALWDVPHFRFPFGSHRHAFRWLQFELYSGIQGPGAHRATFTFEYMSELLLEAGCDMIQHHPHPHRLRVVARKKPTRDVPCAACGTRDLSVSRWMFQGMCSRCRDLAVVGEVNPRVAEEENVRLGGSMLFKPGFMSFDVNGARLS
jgi:hypothetical protein